VGGWPQRVATVGGHSGWPQRQAYQKWGREKRWGDVACKGEGVCKGEPGREGGCKGEPSHPPSLSGCHEMMACGAQLELIGIALIVRGFWPSVMHESQPWINASCPTLQLKWAYVHMIVSWFKW
jgi:hypothetical protein